LNEPMTSHRNDRMLFVWLLLAGLLGSLVGVPYTIAVLMDPAAGGPVDPRLVWLSALAEALFLLAPASAAGVWLGNKVGLGPRILRELVSKVPEGWERARANLKLSMFVGLALGVIGLSQYQIPQGALGPGLQNPTAFEYALRSLSAALTEEILFRLGLMTFFVWAIRSIVKRPASHAPSLWVGNALAALLFAGAHLPYMLAFGTPGWSILIPLVTVSALSGITMGWLYMQDGLISAIVAHFVTDAVVYVLPKLLTAIT
jgi:hypothetical protein